MEQNQPTPLTLSWTGPVAIKPPKKSPLIIFWLLFLLLGLWLWGFFVLNNFSKTSENNIKANILDTEGKTNSWSQNTQTPEQVILELQNNFVDSTSKQIQNKKDITYSTDTSLTVSNIVFPIPMEQKLNSVQYKLISKNSQIKYDMVNQKVFLDWNVDASINSNFSSWKNNFDLWFKFLLDWKAWANSWNAYLMPRNFWYQIKWIEKLWEMMMWDNLDYTNLNIKTNYENWLLGIKFVWQAATSISKALSGKVIYISKDDIKNLKDENIKSLTQNIQETTQDIEIFSWENYLKTIPLFVSEKTGSRYLLKQNPDFTGWMLSSSLKQLLFQDSNEKNFNSNLETKFILASALMPRLIWAQATARDTSRIVWLGQLKSGLEVFYSDNWFYPESEKPSDVKNLAQSLSWIMSNIPADPQSWKKWTYQSLNSWQNYIILAGIENSSKSNLEDLWLSWENIYIQLDNSWKKLDDKTIQQAINNFSKTENIQSTNNNYIWYFDFLAADKFKFSPASQELSWSYIIFSTKNILEFFLTTKDENSQTNINFKDWILDWKITIPNESWKPYEIKLNWNYENQKNNLKISFDWKEMTNSFIQNFVFETNNQKSWENISNTTNINLESVFWKLTFISKNNIKNWKDFDIQMPKKYDLKWSELSGQVAKILINDPQIINIWLEFFTNQVVYWLQEKLSTNTWSNWISVSFSWNNNFWNISWAVFNSWAQTEKIDLNLFNDFASQIQQWIWQENSDLLWEDIVKQLSEKFSNPNVLKIALLKWGLKNIFAKKWTYPESNFWKVASLSQLDEYFSNIPQDIFYKSVSKNNQKNSCYIILAGSKWGISNTSWNGFKDFMNIETYEQYQKILNYDIKNWKYYISSCE